MRKLAFVKVNPVENMTILVKEKLPREEYAKIAQELMEYKNVFAEQVGFMEGNHLQMMGGEFCGNASRSFASYLAFCDESFEGEKYYDITCSGYAKPLSVWVRQGKEKHQFLAKIAMPDLLSMSEDILSLGEQKESIIRVDLGGITHFIVDFRLDYEQTIAAMVEKMSQEEYEAFGVLFFDQENMEMLPYVHVKGISGVWERSCGSGTTALGYYFRQYHNMEKAKIKQPGGYLEVSFQGEQIFIDGLVEIVAEGTAYLEK